MPSGARGSHSSAVVPRTKLAPNSECTVGLLGEAVDHAEAKAAALADLLGREEGLHYLFEHVGGDAGAGVRDAELHIIAGRKPGPIAGTELSIVARTG